MAKMHKKLSFLVKTVSCKWPLIVSVLGFTHKLYTTIIIHYIYIALFSALKSLYVEGGISTMCSIHHG